ncbi:SAM-dependent methyltransferase [Rhodovarius crocodyli]|uniref:SAM-dependent methyltransferase n=1 Tax=Rhodovarius crocodyli TaxID=1979269 RepID=A0A437MF58_9PROT|nr:methyltransferase [Rhodovarius crocodyli]RVT96298.1 SAM-dependent methyltransferase [Rhodovarius crocodyli]
MNSDSIRDVLETSSFNGANLVLPGTLTRSEYQAVNKAIEAAGGKWDKKARAHVFPRDARQALAPVLAGSDLTKPPSRKKELQAFFSPPGVVERVISRAAIGRRDLVLEPSAGHGALALAAQAAGGRVECCDIDSDHVDELRRLGLNARIYDFLKLAPNPAYDRVVMNPPFRNLQDVDHVTHALGFLKTGCSRLVAVMSPGFQYRQTRKAKAFRELLASRNSLVETLPEQSFKIAGTSVSTLLVTITG